MLGDRCWLRTYEYSLTQYCRLCRARPMCFPLILEEKYLSGSVQDLKRFADHLDVPLGRETSSGRGYVIP